MTPKYRTIREAAGKTQIDAAYESGTSPPTVRVFENAGPDAIAYAEKRAALVSYYAALARSLELRHAV